MAQLVDVVLYALETPDNRLVISKKVSQAEGRKIMRSVAGKALDAR